MILLKSILFFFICSISLYCFDINGTIEGYTNKKLLFFAIKGEEKKLFDSTTTNNKGNFLLRFSDFISEGIYEMRTEKNYSLELIFIKNNIDFKTDLQFFIDSLHFHNSPINSDYYFYQREKKIFSRKFELLQPLIFEYPENNEFYYKIQNEYLKIQIEFEKTCNELIKKNQNNFLSKYIINDQPVIVYPNRSYDSVLKLLKKHYFDLALFDDALILNSGMLPERIISYLALYMDKNLNKDLLQNEYIKATDYLLTLPIENDEIYNFILEYLQQGFQKFHFDKVLEHISVSYHYRERCENDERRLQLQQRLEKINNLTLGKVAPDIKLPDISGKFVNLYEINSDFTLLVFWASWCQHCTELLPKLNGYYKNFGKDKLSVIAISIDTNSTDLKKYLQKNSFDWYNINVSDGWDSKVCYDYNIYATPTMLLLDKNKRIISKPISIESIKIEIK